MTNRIIIVIKPSFFSANTRLDHDSFWVLMSRFDDVYNLKNYTSLSENPLNEIAMLENDQYYLLLQPFLALEISSTWATSEFFGLSEVATEQDMKLFLEDMLRFGFHLVDDFVFTYWSVAEGVIRSGALSPSTKLKYLGIIDIMKVELALCEL